MNENNHIKSEQSNESQKSAVQTMVEGFKHTEVGLIPKDWEVHSLEELGNFKKGRNIPKSSILEYGVPCILYGEIYTKYNFHSPKLFSRTSIEIAKNSTEIKKGDVLFAGSGETAEDIGKCFTYTGTDNAYAGGDVIVFSPKECDPLYLGFLLNSADVVRQKSYMGQGSSVFHIYPSNLKKILIPLPPTKAEQTAIATVLNDADALIQKLEQLIAKKRLIKQGAMQELLKPKEGWEVKKLGELANIEKGEQINRETLSDNDVYPVYNGGIFPSGYTNKFNTEANSIIISEGGNSCGYVNYITERFWRGGHCYLVKTNLDKMFIYQLIKSHEKNIMSLRVGSGLPNIQRGRLLGYEIYIPIKHTEQTRIAQILSDMDNEIEELEKQLEKYKMMKQGMMQVLLTGKIRLDH